VKNDREILGLNLINRRNEDSLDIGENDGRDKSYESATQKLISFSSISAVKDDSLEIRSLGNARNGRINVFNAVKFF
jgi:hypothetical protein